MKKERTIRVTRIYTFEGPESAVRVQVRSSQMKFVGDVIEGTFGANGSRCVVTLTGQVGEEIPAPVGFDLSEWEEKKDVG